MPLNRRLAGILLHPTSLPGPHGIGDLGPAAYRLLDWMASAGLAYWQVLPLGPTSFGDSPYQCFSAFAGNPLLVSPDILREDGLATLDDVLPPQFPGGIVDYGWVISWKNSLLRAVHQRFVSGGFHEIRNRYDRWRSQPDVVDWLEDYALFMACKDANEGRAWNTWERELRAFKKSALDKARKQHADNIEYHRFAQFLFFDQWNRIRKSAHERAIEVIGDAPIYVSYDSADTWAHQHLFQLDENGNPTSVAGVPPDYFSATGQLWGNPLYDWERMEQDGFAWWAARMKAIFATVDIVRLDHFRGFMGYYAVPFGNPTAEHGKWRRGPGAKFFVRMKEVLGDLPIIAEDLGEITTDVTEVRRQFHLPGMVILQFAWTPAGHNPLVADPNNHFLPHAHERESVVYTGTHDNDTSLGWWRHTSTPAERAMMQVYLSVDGNAANWDLIRVGMTSIANTFVVPVQDLLDLDSEHRMNMPGRPEGNWSWRLSNGQMSELLGRKVREMTLLYGRCLNSSENAREATPKAPPY
ncbi:MAG: 4-alpha-glucanotransferase [Candidatus Sumerlaeaceae bacterium]